MNPQIRRPRIWNGPAPVLPAKHWFTFTNLGGNAADLWLYDEVGGWGVTAEMLVSELKDLNVADITLHINSPGGDVFDGIAILNALRDHPANITVKVDALAASIASVIAQAGNKIIMGRNSTMMIHNASGFAMGEAKDLRKLADLLDSTTANIASIYAERAGGTAKQWLKVMDEETWYTADEAVAAGLADEVAPAQERDREALAAAARFDLTARYQHAPALTNSDPEPEVETPPAVPAPAVPPMPLMPANQPAAWDPAAFRAAVGAAARPEPIAWDPDLFRGAVHVVTNDVPDLPTPDRTPALTDRLPPEPTPPVPGQWDGAGLLRAAIGLVTNDMPAVPPEPPTPPPAGGWDSTMFDLAIREAQR